MSSLSPCPAFEKKVHKFQEGMSKYRHFIMVSPYFRHFIILKERFKWCENLQFW